MKPLTPKRNEQAMKAIQIKLQYITATGCEWLEEIVEVNESNYLNIIDKYVKESQQKADALETKWQSNGEDEYLYLNVEPIDVGYIDELFKKVYTYVENL
jgi:hypothetical protein